MVPTYTSKGARRYRYYVCRVAHKKGWSECPTKAIATGVIEQSVVAQIRTALGSDGIRHQLQISDAERLAFDEGEPRDLIRAVVERVTYDGASGAVSLELNRK